MNKKFLFLSCLLVSMIELHGTDVLAAFPTPIPTAFRAVSSFQQMSSVRIAAKKQKITQLLTTHKRWRYFLGASIISLQAWGIYQVIASFFEVRTNNAKQTEQNKDKKEESKGFFNGVKEFGSDLFYTLFSKNFALLIAQGYAAAMAQRFVSNQLGVVWHDDTVEWMAMQHAPFQKDLHLIKLYIDQLLQPNQAANRAQLQHNITICCNNLIAQLETIVAMMQIKSEQLQMKNHGLPIAKQIIELTNAFTQKVAEIIKMDDAFGLVNVVMAYEKSLIMNISLFMNLEASKA